MDVHMTDDATHDPLAMPFCENCGSTACCHAAGERAATERITAWLEAQGGGSVLKERERHYARKFAAAIERGEHEREREA
jgi:hypothetical protein